MSKASALVDGLKQIAHSVDAIVVDKLSEVGR